MSLKIDDQFKNMLFSVTDESFTDLCIKVFNYQYTENEVYKKFCSNLNVNPNSVDSILKIPFLPIRFFKNKKIVCGNVEHEIIFESSGTTGSVNSKHFVNDIGIYEKSFLECFKSFYPNYENYCIIGLLPSYLERKNSSLVYMVNELIKKSSKKASGFYLYDFENLKTLLLKNEEKEINTILIGVTYALIDFADKFSLNLKHTTIMETGGMKGRKAEMTRQEVHKILKTKLGVNNIHSEYGMTELLSQAYSKTEGIFYCPNWMKVLLRAEDDPLDVQTNNGLGAINIIDLANIYSCSFIATDDIGKLNADGGFEVIGRLDNSDIRGCGLMYNIE